MARVRKKRRGSLVKAYALLVLAILVVGGGIAAIGMGVHQLLQPREVELPEVVGTMPDVVETFQPEDDLIIVEPEELEDDRPVVVIDPGHGGTDGGTEGIILEKEMTTGVASALYDLMSVDERFVVVLTRPLIDEEYTYLSDRVEITKEAGADLFLSIHGNAFAGEEVRGTECFAIPPEREFHEESVKFASLVAEKFGEQGAKLRGATGVRYGYFDGDRLYYGEQGDEKDQKDLTYMVLQEATYPAVLVEQCYISSEKDMEIFGGEDGYAMAAQVYYDSICEYFFPNE